MRLRRCISAGLVLLVSMLPGLRAACDMACAPVRAAYPAPMSEGHCATPDAVPAPDQPDDRCGHNHQRESLIVSRAVAHDAAPTAFAALPAPAAPIFGLVATGLAAPRHGRLSAWPPPTFLPLRI